jgi:hypothetical protein
MRCESGVAAAITPADARLDMIVAMSGPADCPPASPATVQVPDVMVPVSLPKSVVEFTVSRPQPSGVSSVMRAQPLNSTKPISANFMMLPSVARFWSIRKTALPACHSADEQHDRNLPSFPRLATTRFADHKIHTS